MISEEFLKRHHADEWLSQLSREHLNKLLPLAQEAQFKRDQVLFREGGKSENLYLVVSGSVALEVIAAGQAIQISSLHPGDVLGWSAISEDGHARFQARAVEAVSALAFPGQPLRELCDGDPALGYALLKQLLGLVTERLDATRFQLVDMYSQKEGQRA
jgi:CRP-like cAMP-binding protein